MLSADEARQLDRLRLATSAAAPAGAAGLRHTKTRGHGIEFKDYRHYQAGDDPRSIDWTVDARLRQLVVRLFRAEGNVRVHLLLDVSRSMTIGTPTKLACAQKLAAALAYVAVERRDPIGIATFAETIHARVAPASGRPQLFRVLDTLAQAQPMGESAIGRALTAYGNVARGAGLVVILSDFFDPEGSFEGLRYLMYRGFTPAPIQIVADNELDPGITGDVELVDIEHASPLALVVDQSAVQAYRARMAGLTTDLHEFCLAHRLPCLQVTSSMRFEALLKKCLQAGLLAAHA